MKITELIKDLVDVVKTRGDLDVLVYGDTSQGHEPENWQLEDAKMVATTEHHRGGQSRQVVLIVNR